MTASPSEESLSMEPIRLFGMGVHPVRQSEAVATILRWIHEPDGQMHYVVTPNVQHAVLFQKHADFREAYQHASLVLLDGTPLLWAAALFGEPVPERVTGSDLVPAVLSSGKDAQPLTVFLLGAAPGVGERAARVAESLYPGLRVVGTYSPPFGFEEDPAENDRILELIAKADPSLLIVGLGAPKQELWVYRNRARLHVPAVVCAGATIDFLAGEKRRAPPWMRKTGLEWMHRMLTEPRRLAPRYATDAIRFPHLVLREWMRRGNGSS